MGLQDRDYMRPGGGSGSGGFGGGGLYTGKRVNVGPWSSMGLGNLRVISFNTWLIIINVAVFLVMAFTPGLRSEIAYGQYALHGFTPQDLKQGFVDTSRWVPLSADLGMPTPQGHPIVRKVGKDSRGQTLVETIGVQAAAPAHLFTVWGHFSTARAFLGWEVWRFLTFQFLHANITHLIFNMLGLWFVGGLVEQYLGSKRYAAFYLTAGIFGALMYLLLNFVGTMIQVYVSSGVRIPGLLFVDIHTPLVGASAGIFGVLMAAAFIAPSAIVYIFGLLPLKMRTAVYVFTAIALFNLLSDSKNAGGEAAHIGGALAGFYFIRRTHLLRDFFDLMGNSTKAEPEPGGAGGGRGRFPFTGPRPGPGSDVVGEILKKVELQGLRSLTEAERRTLRQATEAQRNG